jgi:threonine synthase
LYNPANSRLSRLFSGRCAQCGRIHRAALPPGVPRGQIGPRALAFIGVLGTHYHLTQFKIRDLLARMMGVDFSVGAISQAQGKLAQALLYGAEVLAVKGNFDRALAIVQEVANRYPITLVNSVNPYRLQGQKTAAFEVVDALGEAPDWLCIPVGNAGNISAYWMGFNEYKAAGHSRRLPRMMGFQAAGSAPLVLGHTVEQPDTIATAIRIGNPVNKERALKARAESNGDFMAVTDAEIIEAYKLLGSGEGVFCEPASAASVAGLIKRREEVPAGATVVCVLTGNGLKDPTTAIEHNDSKFHTGLEPDTATVARVMGF